MVDKQHRNMIKWLHQQSTTEHQPERMSRVGLMGEFKVSAVMHKGNELALARSLTGTLTLFNNSACNTLQVSGLHREVS